MKDTHKLQEIITGGCAAAIRGSPRGYFKPAPKAFYPMRKTAFFRGRKASFKRGEDSLVRGSLPLIGRTSLSFARSYGNRKMLIVAEDKNANTASFALAPLLIRRQIEARFRPIAQVLEL
jgi:hypothetical protein